MTSRLAIPEHWRKPGAVSYMIVCLAAVAVIYLVLEECRLGTARLVPVAVGAVGVVARWPSAPLLLVMALGVSLSVGQNRQEMFDQGSGLRIADLLLCLGVLAYCCAHYRLQSLLTRVLPAEARGWKEAPSLTLPARSGVRRSAELVTLREIIRWVLWLPFWALLAQAAAWLAPTDWGNPGVRQPFWQAIVFSWLGGFGFLATAWVLDYYRRRRMTAAEALVYLQDAAWEGTRGEQRRIQRWHAWARRKRSRARLGERTFRFPKSILFWLVALLVLLIIINLILYLVLWGIPDPPYFQLPDHL